MAASEGTRFAPFDIVVVPFPYADRLAQKRRPALVISNHKLAIHGLVPRISLSLNPGYACLPTGRYGIVPNLAQFESVGG